MCDIDLYVGRSSHLTATVKVSTGSVSANAEFVINRQDFGVSYPGRADHLIQDNVLLTIKVVAPRS